MNRKRELDEIANLYLESSKPEELETEKNVKDKDVAKDTGPEAADGVDLNNVDGEGDDQYNTDKLSDPAKKSVKESINNFNMSNKSSNNKSEFDRLYEFAMEGEGDLNELEVDAMGGDDLDLGDDLGDDMDDMGGGDLRSRLEELRDTLDGIIGELDGGDMEDDMGDDMDMGDDLEDLEGENVRHEKVVSEPEPKPLGGHGDRQHPDSGKGPWSKRASGAFSGKGGNAEHGKVDEDPEPKVLGGHGDRQHKDAGNTGSGSNKVKAGKKNNPGAHALGN